MVHFSILCCPYALVQLGHTLTWLVLGQDLIFIWLVLLPQEQTGHVTVSRLKVVSHLQKRYCPTIPYTSSHESKLI